MTEYIMTEYPPKQGSLLIEHFRDGELLGRRGRKFLWGNVPKFIGDPNTVTTVGKAHFANLFIGTGDAMSHIALGTGTTAAAAGDTDMETEIYREAATVTRVTITTTNDTSQFTKTFTIDDTYDLTEAGLFNHTSAGILCCHQIYTVLPVESADTIKATWRLQH